MPKSTFARISLTIFAVGALAACGDSATEVDAEAPAEDVAATGDVDMAVIEQRQENYEEIGDNFKIIRDQLESGDPDRRHRLIASYYTKQLDRESPLIFNVSNPPASVPRSLDDTQYTQWQLAWSAPGTKLGRGRLLYGADVRLEMTLRLLDLALARMARLGTGLAPAAEAVSGEFDTLARLAPDGAAARKWAALQQELSREAAHARAVNIDAQSLLLSLFLKVNDAA